jgi:deoxyribonuclease IV
MACICEVKWTVGAHTCFEKRICDTLWTSVNYGMYATQFFMGNPYSFTRAEITSGDIEESKKILRRFPMSVFTHFPYVCNLCGSKDILAWNGHSAQDAKTGKVLQCLEYELGVVASLGVERSGVVLHPGNYPDRKIGLETIGRSINKINFAKGSKLVLENSAGQGTSLATTFREIRTILDSVDESKRGNIGVCIDTCHIYAYGEYDLSRISEVDRMFREFDECVGLDKLSLVHLNDSETVRGSKKDRHACLGQGKIWKGGMESLVYLLNKCERNKVPMVLETDMVDMLTLANL